MSVLRFDEVIGRARAAKALPLLLRERLISRRLRSKRRELRQIRSELLHNADSRAKSIEYKKRKKRVQQEIFRLDCDLRRVAKELSNGVLNGRQAPRGTGEAATCALPDFLIIGARKCSTTFLYDLLTRHPYVESAAKKSCTTSTSSSKKRDSSGTVGAFRRPGGRMGEGSSPERPAPIWMPLTLSPREWQGCFHGRG